VNDESSLKLVKEALRNFPRNEARPYEIINKISEKYGKVVTRKILWKLQKNHPKELRRTMRNKQHTVIQLIETGLHLPPPPPPPTIITDPHPTFPDPRRFKRMKPETRHRFIAKVLPHWFKNYLGINYIESIPTPETNKLRNKGITENRKFTRNYLRKIIKISMKYEEEYTRGVLKTVTENHNIPTKMD